ncbi:MAG: hypothetical protein H7Y86_22540 [Rhizobacter sp.]|nr:hypothetical protein [Ferruginibacter sp.]
MKGASNIFGRQRLNRIRYDDGAQGLLILLFISQLFLTNGIYLFLGAAVLAYVLYNLQQPLKPSVFTLIFLYHFVQVAANIWLSNYLGKDLDFRSASMEEATICGFAGIFILFVPIIYYQGKIPNVSLSALRVHANKMSIEKTFKAYLIAFFVANALGGVAFVIPGLSQVIFSVINIKWFFFLLFGYQVLLKRRMMKHFVILCSAEFLLGFISYFSDFKTVIFFGAFLAVSFIMYVKLKHLCLAIAGLVLVSFLAVKWTAVKGEYRVFLNQGSKSQNVSVSGSDAINKLIDLGSEDIDYEKVDPVYDFLDRIQYTYHLAKTMDRIPAVLPHEYGANIGRTLEFVFTPRFLNPDKPIFKATEKTRKYTGISYAGYEQGVSFSLGYFADCYIDFGYFGMFVPLLILGYIFGSAYFYFVRRSSQNLLFNYAVVGAVFMEFTAFEADSTYVMGRLFATLLTFLMLKLFFFPWLYRQLEIPAARIKTS